MMTTPGWVSPLWITDNRWKIGEEIGSSDTVDSEGLRMLPLSSVRLPQKLPLWEMEPIG
jgi:hypothetical protein